MQRGGGRASLRRVIDTLRLESPARLAFWRSRPRRADLGLAGVLVGFGVAELWIVGVGPKAIALPATVVAGLALYWRRVAPLLTVAVLFGAIAAESLLGVSLHKPDSPLLMALVALYTAGAYLPVRESAVALALAIGGIWTAVASQSTHGQSDFAFTLVVISAGWLVGRGMHGRVSQASELAERTARLEREAAAERVAAVEEERRRIARDLHDVIAHSVSVMVVQAGAAEEIFDRDPPGVLEPIRAVQETGRAALVEISRLLGLLRDDSAELGLTPQPRLEELPELLRRTRAAGLPVELRIEGTPRPLPLGVDLSIYRIAQEALTNVRKHSVDSRAIVVLRYGKDRVELSVENNGRTTHEGHRGGHGLIGMRERVAVFGGSLDAGPRPNGGFQVLARLPLTDDP
jgi:signal transduction histidine kinase